MELKRCSHIVPFFLLVLLIVPYGIETNYTDEETEKIIAFNRTLWN